ncbi:MAG: hypothetical protein WC433_08075, partial [Candidatus Omnitrophota bacterium]
MEVAQKGIDALTIPETYQKALEAIKTGVDVAPPSFILGMLGANVTGDKTKQQEATTEPTGTTSPVDPQISKLESDIANTTDPELKAILQRKLDALKPQPETVQPEQPISQRIQDYQKQLDELKTSMAADAIKSPAAQEAFDTINKGLETLKAERKKLEREPVLSPEQAKARHEQDLQKTLDLQQAIARNDLEEAGKIAKEISESVTKRSQPIPETLMEAKKKPITPESIDQAKQIADKYGVRYERSNAGQHLFTDPTNGSSFHVPVDQMNDATFKSNYSAILENWEKSSKPEESQYATEKLKELNPDQIAEPSKMVEPTVSEPAASETQPATGETQKQPWEMTKREYAPKPSPKLYIYGAGTRSGRMERIDHPDERMKSWRSNILKHKGIIEQAISEGKPVPPEVLAEYPDLVKQLTPEVAQPQQKPKSLKPREKKQKSLIAQKSYLNLVRQNGGLRAEGDLKGELKGLPLYVKNSNGLSLDRMTERLIEQGYPIKSTRELLDLLRSKAEVPDITGEVKPKSDAEQRTEQFNSEEIPVGKLNEGDTFGIQGEDYKVISKQPGKIVVKDGETFVLDEFDKLPIDNGDVTSPKERIKAPDGLGSEGYIEAKKEADGRYKLYFRGTLNEIFPGERFASASEARNYWKVQKAKQDKGGIEKGLRDMAQRIINAEENFKDSVKEQFGFTDQEAQKIWDVYRKGKIVEVDAVGGQHKLKDGRFWDKQVMQNALDQESGKVSTVKQPGAKNEQIVSTELLGQAKVPKNLIKPKGEVKPIEGRGGVGLFATEEKPVEQGDVFKEKLSDDERQYRDTEFVSSVQFESKVKMNPESDKIYTVKGIEGRGKRIRLVDQNNNEITVPYDTRIYPVKEGDNKYSKAWDNDLSLEQKQKLSEKAGWVTQQGNPTLLGKKIVNSKWSELSPAAQNIIKRNLDDTAQPKTLKKPEGVTLLGGNAKAAQANQAEAMQDINKGANYQFKHKEGDKVTDKENGKQYIVKSAYIENGEARYTVYPPGKKQSLGYHVRIKESDLKSPKSLKKPAKQGKGTEFQVSPETAKKLNTPVDLPKDPKFTEAVANTPHSKIVEDGLLIKVTRSQKQEQGESMSVR